MIRIVTAYADLMNQYGEYAALKYLTARLQSAGEEVTVESFSVGDTPDLEGCSLLYIPAGTELSMFAARKDALRLESALTEYLNGGGLALCTGNAMGIFAKNVTDLEGNAHQGIGWLDMDINVVRGRNYTELLAKSKFFEGEIVGAVNSSIKVENRETPLFDVLFDAAGNLGAKTEGAVKNNLFATQLIGPLLVRDPNVLDAFCEKICGRPLPECSESWYAYARKGYLNAVDTLKKESGKRG